MENVRLERAPFFPFSDPIIPLATGNRLLDRTGSEKPSIWSDAYFPEWKLALTQSQIYDR